ncbi:SusC/RagA family TonB-linked outer membrane protein [Chitinophaga niabensis]|uniref:TonB-linked outer membrane protein, SusC/RagA family n=1 Tax=Chitinophaga niabensis TaxID=536979 RepID=A0A1N6JBL4_9BACT|nr:SusC/RagA family TonB-linked outer membrane protein [Chitinophaga niabensis]SIO41754.1 TonB-linked outer membrane protein, SusC/RagA family [Chitinophaga niabensis]
MRLTFTACMRRVLLLIIPLFLCTILFANDSQDGEKITLFEKAVPLKTVFKKITSQTGIKFVYSNRLVDDEQKVDVSVKNASLDEVMQQIFYGRKYELQRTSPKSVVLIVHEKVVSSVTPITAPTNDVAIIDIAGTVSDVTGEKLPGATVLVRGTNKATMTDGEGRFRLAGVFANAKLWVSYTGYEGEEVKLQGQRELNVKLQRGENRLSEVVVAYGTTTQRSNTGAVTVVKGEQIQNLPNRSFDKSLQGLVPGLQITNGTGQPGGGVSSMVQRGVSSGVDPFTNINARNPLIVIDGIPVSQDNFQRVQKAGGTPVTNPLAQINPSDIESISVLRDAAAISLYGSKASNGVILVTTKRGKTGRTTLSLRSQMDVSYLPKRMTRSIPSQAEYLALLYETYRNTNPTLWTDAAIRKDLFNKFPYRVLGSDTSFYPDPAWTDAIFEKGAKTFSNEISLSGGNDKTIYYLNVEYTKQDGIVKNTGFDRKSFRINMENRPFNWLTIGTNTTFSYNVQNVTNLTETESTYGLISTLSPLNPVKLNNGKYAFSYGWGGPVTPITTNPAAKLEYDVTKAISYRGISKLYGEASFLKYFSFKSSVGIDFMLSEFKEKSDPRFRVGTSNVGSIIESDVRRANIIANNILNAKIPITNKHNIDFLLGQEAQIISDKSLAGEVKADSTALPTYDQISSPGYVVSSLSGRSTRQTLLSWFGQINYGYKKKYFISTSIRRDGSSRFGSRELWGTFWSSGASWIVSEEPFLNKSSFFTYLKLRGSVGVSGNSGAVNPSTKFDVLSQGLYADRTAVIMTTFPGNSDIKWERTFSWNAGLDTRFFHDKILLNIDVYNKSTKNLIYQIDLPSVSGYRTVNDNIGDLRNRGIEVSASANIISRPNIRWSLSANWSRNINKLVKAYVPFVALQTGNLVNEVGRNYNSFYLVEWAGVNPDNGKPQWIDSSGKATTVYNSAMKKVVGKPQPDGFGSVISSIGYKNFDLNIQLYYQYGNKVLYEKLMIMMNDGASAFINQSAAAQQYWKKPGDVSDNPRRVLSNTDGGNRASTRYLIDGGYIKLSNVTFTYSLPSKYLSRAGFSMFKIFIQGSNLAIWSPIKDQDPDNVNAIGGISSPYPNSKGFSIGLQSNF